MLANAVRFRWVGFSLLLGLSLACTKDPARPFPSPPSFFYPVIDDYPVWSHGGSVIAFYRFFPSADGPPGIYLVSKWGGQPRLVVPGLFADFRFSPDDRRLVGIASNLQVAIIDVTGGDVAQPFYTNRYVGSPHFSPDGTSIVYARTRDFLSEPPDSGGLHVFDLRSGTDRPIVYNGTAVAGYRPLWLPANHGIAFVDADAIGRERLSVVDPGGSALRILHASRGSDIGAVYWYGRPATAAWGILFTVDDAPPYGGVFLIRPDGSALTILPPFRPGVLGHGHEAFSPDGEEWVHHGIDPVDSLDVLFVSRVDDLSGASSRQLTRYSPPPSTSAAVRLNRRPALVESVRLYLR